MELKLNIYKTRLCRDVDRVVTAKDFKLSTGICEDVLNIINIDMFEGGLDSLSNETMQDIVLGIVKDGFPFFLELIKEIFELSDDEGKKIDIGEVATVVIAIVKYSFSQLATALGGKNSKN